MSVPSSMAMPARWRQPSRNWAESKPIWLWPVAASFMAGSSNSEPKNPGQANEEAGAIAEATGAHRIMRQVEDARSQL
jgi:hypothetical protein